MFSRKEAEKCPQFFPFEEQLKSPLDKLRGNLCLHQQRERVPASSAVMLTSRSVSGDQAPSPQVWEAPPLPLSAPPPTSPAPRQAHALLFRGPRPLEPPLPFVVLAVEEPVEDLAQGADVMQIVEDDDERHVRGVVLAGTLVGKVGQVLAQFL